MEAKIIFIISGNAAEQNSARDRAFMAAEKWRVPVEVWHDAPALPCLKDNREVRGRIVDFMV